MDRGLLARVLVAVATTEPAREALSPDALDRLAGHAGLGPFELRALCAYAQSAGLVRMSARDTPWHLTEAGRQFLARGGAVDDAVLAFLPQTIDDLDARSALIRGARSFVGDFRAALLDGRVRSHAASLVPGQFRALVDEATALDIFSAAVALVVRLEAEQPPACMAEQLLAPWLVTAAEGALAQDVERGELSDDAAAAARAEFRSLWKLIPSRGTPRAPVQGWFRPFPGAPAAAYAATAA